MDKPKGTKITITEDELLGKVDNLKEAREKLLDRLTMIPLDLELEEGHFIKTARPLIAQHEKEVIKATRESVLGDLRKEVEGKQDVALNRWDTGHKEDKGIAGVIDGEYEEVLDIIDKLSAECNKERK